jgi:ABC-2 type transport system ATP-binding protein
MSTAPIVVDRASKWFGDVVAVSEVSFEISTGVTALLGPNGAGKSTVLRMLAGLTPPSEGTVRVLGADPHRNVGLVRSLGLVPQQEALFEPLSALEFVRLAAVLHGLPHPDKASRFALRLVHIDPDERRSLATYSKGMRQRVKLAQALVHDPQIVILDEPLTGLDPRQRRHSIELFVRLGADGRSVIVSSHVLDEVERFGSRVLVMTQGRLAAEGDFHAIRELMEDRPHRVRIRCDRPRKLAATLLASEVAIAVELVGDDTVIVETHDIARFGRSVVRIAVVVDTHLFEVLPLDDDLESVFRYLVGS